MDTPSIYVESAASIVAVIPVSSHDSATTSYTVVLAGGIRVDNVPTSEGLKLIAGIKGRNEA